MASPKRKKIVFFNRWTHPDGQDLLESFPEVDLQHLSWDAPEEENWRVLGAAHGYQVSSARQELPPNYRVTSEFLAKCPELLAVSADGAGYDTVDVEECTDAGIVVVNQSGANREAVAEHVLGMILCLSKRMVEMDRAMRRNRDWHRNDFLGNDLYGKTVGIIGLGNIGTRVAELCSGLFAARIVAYDPYLTNEQILARGAAASSLEKLLSDSDFVSVNCPLTNETRGMIDGAALARMRTSAYFVTTARGGIHDEEALALALASGAIRGAGLDVWVDEPPPIGHVLHTFDNVIMTMHTAGVTEEARRQAGIGAAEQWMVIWGGNRPSNVVNPEVWPRFHARFKKVFEG